MKLSLRIILFIFAMTPQQYLTGIVAGGLIGGGVNGITALANGRTFMSGTIKPPPTSTVRPSLPSLNSSKPEVNTEGMRAKPLQMADENTFTVRTTTSETLNYSSIEGQGIKLNLQRPDISGYSPSLAGKTDLYHNFPRLLDETIIQNGSMAQRISDGSFMFTAPGTINGIKGVYTIGVTPNGIIYHRTFYDWAIFLKKF